MSRLQYDKKAFLRLLQMSQCNVFVFVEGWTDRYFYDKLCQLAFKGASITYQVRTSEEISGSNVGKAALLGFFSYLRERKFLFHEFKGKKLATVFFLDKDIDDYLRARKRSKHVAYTEHYSLENYLFKYSPLVDVAAAAACLDVCAVASVITDQENWLRRAALEWKEWIGLCLLTRIIGVNSRSNYGRHQSQVNNGAYGGIIPSSVPKMRAEILTASGLSNQDFDLIERRVNRLVDRAFSEGRQDRIFRGTWYGRFLVEDVEKAAAGRHYNSNGLQTRFLAIANSRLDFACPWAAPFLGPLRSVMALF
jgi:hypothetical protein